MYGPPPGPQAPMPAPPAPRKGNGKKIALIVGGALIALFAFFWVVGTIAGPPPEKPSKPAAAPTTTPSATTAAVSPPAATTQAAAPPPVPASSRPAPAPTTPTAGPARAPQPTPAQQRTYLATIARIDQGLVVNEERAMRRAGRICERIVRPPGGNLTLEQYTVLELSGGNATINEAQARQVIKAVHVWCQPR